MTIDLFGSTEKKMIGKMKTYFDENEFEHLRIARAFDMFISKRSTEKKSASRKRKKTKKQKKTKKKRYHSEQ